MALPAKKKRMLAVMFIITTCIFIALGQLVGAALFFRPYIDTAGVFIT